MFHLLFYHFIFLSLYYCLYHFSCILYNIIHIISVCSVFTELSCRLMLSQLSDLCILFILQYASHLFSSSLLSYCLISASLSSLNPCSNMHIHLNNKLEDDVQPLHYHIRIFCLYHISSISSHPPKSCQQTKPAKRQIVSDRIVFNLGQPPESIAFTATGTFTNCSAICRDILYVIFQKKTIVAPLRLKCNFTTVLVSTCLEFQTKVRLS